MEVLVGLFILLVLGFLILVPIIAITVFIWLRHRKRKKAGHQFYPYAGRHFKKKHHHSGALIDISHDPPFESDQRFSSEESYSYAESFGNENWQTDRETSNSWDWSSSSGDLSSSDSGWSSSDLGSSSDSSSSSSD